MLKFIPVNAFIKKKNLKSKILPSILIKNKEKEPKLNPKKQEEIINIEEEIKNLKTRKTI